MEQPGQSLHYAAFISYRHSERDDPLAEALHRQLETFVFPSGAIRKKEAKKKFGRVFRDKDELPLAGDLPQTLQMALAQSEWLICLLCDDYFESLYCVNELKYFASLHGISRIIPVISAGRASDILPKFLTALDGFEKPNVESGIPFEPLAMEIGGESRKERLKNLEKEKLRLFARMLGVNYDDLFRRFHRRRVRVVAAASAAAVAVVSAFALFALYSAVQIEKERAEAVKNEMQLLISRSLSDSDSGNKLEAAQKALDAYARYTNLYPSGDLLVREQISQALSAAAYSQPYQSVQNIHNDNRLLHGLCFSPDDRYILGITGGGVALIDAVSGAVVSESTHGGTVNAAEFSPSGKYYLAAEYMTDRVEVYAADPPVQPVADCVYATSQVEELVGASFISDDTILLSSSKGKLVEWNFVSGFFNVVAEGEILQGTIPTGGAVVSPNGKLAVCPLDFPSDTLPVIDIRTGERLTYEMPVRLAGDAFAFSDDGGLLAGAFVDTVVIWDTATLNILLTRKIDGIWISGLLFSPDGKTIAVMSAENVTLIASDDGKMLRTLGEADLQTGLVLFGAVFSPDGKEIFIFGNCAEVYDVESGRLIDEMNGQMALSGAYSHDGKRFVVVTRQGSAGLCSTFDSATAFEVDGGVELYAYPRWFELEKQPALLIRTHVFDSSVYIAMQEYLINGPSGEYIAAVYPDGFVEVWSTAGEDGRPSYLLREHYGIIMQARMTEDYLLTAGYDGRIMVFDLKQGVVRHFISVGERIPRFEVNMAGDMLIALTESGITAKVYDLHSGKQIYELRAETGDSIADIGFTADGKNAVIVMKSGRALAGGLLQDFDALLARARELAGVR